MQSVAPTDPFGNIQHRLGDPPVFPTAEGNILSADAEAAPYLTTNDHASFAGQVIPVL
jgi:hypothetical protein